MSRRGWCRAIVVVAATSFALWSRSADAVSPVAEALFQRGRELLVAGRIEEACGRFAESHAVDPSSGTLLNLALCHEQQRKTATAWGEYRAAARLARAQGREDRAAVADERATSLEPTLAYLTIVVASRAKGTVVTRDGFEVERASWGVAVPIDPGNYLIEGIAPNRRSWSRKTTIPDAPTNVSVTVPPLEALSPTSFRLESSDLLPMAPDVAPAPTIPPANTTVDQGNRSLSLAILGLAVLGTAAVGTAVVYSLRLHTENEQAKALCLQDDPFNYGAAVLCSKMEEKARHDMLVSKAHDDRTMAFLGAGVGAACLLAEAYLYWWRWRPAHSSPAGTLSASVRGRPLFGATGAGFGGQLAIEW